ncbi:hypothetical protein CEXT_136391 [Caerostris extrusa]|uniref:Uncharacterized protein n=1 Tax=Caerostris extrusa TaxID=172846 RepID=A0AAV4U2D2_CAEEX|nr:hypothetical protein CEXT_136391 [Caerostris extrusa]
MPFLFLISSLPVQIQRCSITRCRTPILSLRYFERHCRSVLREITLFFHLPQSTDGQLLASLVAQLSPGGGTVGGLESHNTLPCTMAIYQLSMFWDAYLCRLFKAGEPFLESGVHFASEHIS